jgi:hypothetical protein
MAAVAEIGAARPYHVQVRTALDETNAALAASYLIGGTTRFHYRRYAVSYETVSNDEAKLAVLGACDARAVLGDKFPKSREVEDFGRQELFYDFFVPCPVAHIASLPDFGGELWMNFI